MQNASDFSIESMPQSWNTSPYDRNFSQKNSPLSRGDPQHIVANKSPLRRPGYKPNARLRPSGPHSASAKEYQDATKQEGDGQGITPALGIKDTNEKEGCRCLHITACLVEELGAKSANNDLAAMDVLLCDFRESLANCAAILDCEKCTSASENNMLLAMAGRYMSTLCERIVKCYIGMQDCSERQPLVTVSSPWPSVKPPIKKIDFREDGGVSSKSTGDMWFSTYRIEGSQERTQVLRCLVTVQISEFCKLLNKLKARSGSRKGHLVLLSEAEGRTQAAVAILKSSRGFLRIQTP